MKKRLTALALACALALPFSPALAAEGDKFPAILEYPGYGDVAQTDWFYDNAKLCYETGLMTGTETGFEPDKTITGPECAALAARMLEKLTGKAIVMPTPKPGEELLWYQGYVDYLYEAIDASGSSLYGIIQWGDQAAFEQPASRWELVVFLALVADGNGDYFPAINQVEALPDVGATDNVTRFFYETGILTGTDKYGTFAGERTVTRAEVAAMVSRMARPELRLAFSPADYSPFTAAGMMPGDVLFNGGITAEEYLPLVLERIAQLEERDAALGVEFNWFHTTEDGSTYLDDVKEYALSRSGVSRRDGTDLYAGFDVQVFYSRYLDVTEGRLPA